MAAAPIHAVLATPADYSLAFVTAGGPAAVNASDMRVEVESSHWFVVVAPHELVARGLRYTLSYAQLNELMWCVAACDAGLQAVRFVQVGVELPWMEGLLQACLNAGLPRTPLRSWSAVCDALAACARSLSGAAAASRALMASDLRKLQVGGGRGTHAFSGAAGDLARAAWLEALEVGGVIASGSGSTRILALLERLLAPGVGRWQMSGRDDSTGVCAATATRILRTAGAVTNNPQIASDSAASQAAEIVIFLSVTLPVAPMVPNPAPTASAVLQYVIVRQRTAVERFIIDFSESWAAYPAFAAVLHDASDSEARQHITAWLACQDSSATLAEVAVSGLHAKVLRALPAVTALGPGSLLLQRVAEVSRILAAMIGAASDGGDASAGSVFGGVHAASGYVSLVAIMRPYDVQPMDGLAVCSQLLQHPGTNFGRALLLATSDTKFVKVDDMWRRMFDVRTYMAQAFANIVCVTSMGTPSPLVAPHFPVTVAAKALAGNLGHGVGATQLDVYNAVVLQLAPLQYPAGHTLPACAASMVYTNLRAYDESVRMLQLIWAAVGQDNSVPAGCHDFCVGVRALLVRADSFAVHSQQRGTLMFLVQELFTLATEDRAKRRRSALSGALSAAQDSDVWMPLGSAVEIAYAAIGTELELAEAKALRSSNAARYHASAGLAPPTSFMTPSCISSLGNVPSAFCPPGVASSTISFATSLGSSASHLPPGMPPGFPPPPSMVASVAPSFVPSHSDAASIDPNCVAARYAYAGAKCADMEWNLDGGYSYAIDGFICDGRPCQDKGALIQCPACIGPPMKQAVTSAADQASLAMLCAYPHSCVAHHRPAHFSAVRHIYPRGAQSAARGGGGGGGGGPPGAGGKKGGGRGAGGGAARGKGARGGRPPQGRGNGDGRAGGASGAASGNKGKGNAPGRGKGASAGSGDDAPTVPLLPPCLLLRPRIRHAPMILLLMDGGDDGVGSLPFELRALGAVVVAMDVKRTSFPVQDVLSESAMAEKWQGLERGDFQGAIMAPNCRGRTVKRLERDGPPQLVSRANPVMLPSIPKYEVSKLLHDNAAADVCARVAAILHAQGHFFIIESPADRGDRSRPDLFEEKWADHAPLLTLPCFRPLLQSGSITTVWFHQACFGSDFLKPTDMHSNPTIAPWLAPLASRRTPWRAQPKKAAGWSDGMLYSQEAAKFPPRLCRFLAQAVQHWLVDKSWLAAPVPPRSPAAAPAGARHSAARPVGVGCRLHESADVVCLQFPLFSTALCLLPVQLTDRRAWVGLAASQVVGRLLGPDDKVSKAIKTLCQQLGLDHDLAFGCGLWQATPSSHALSVFAYPAPGEASAHDIFQWTDARSLEEGPCATVVAIALHATSLAGHGNSALPEVALGRWKNGPVTAVRSVEGRRFADAPAAADAGTQFDGVVAQDESWCRDLRLALEAADGAPEAVRALAAQVKGMREYLSDLPVPAQGAPDFCNPAFAKWPLPARLPPPSTACLHSIPPQRDVFGKYGPRWWCSHGAIPGVFNADGARVAIDICHQARDWCYAAYTARGQPHALRRPPATVLGDGMFESLQTIDGSWAPACVNVWAFDVDSGRPRLFDWSLGFRSQFSVEALVDFLGNGDDQLTLATLSRGTLFLTDPPRHMRLLPNQDGYGLHLEALAEDIIKLESQGFYSVREVLGSHDALSATSPSPFEYLPGWCTGLSGVDKSTSALEKRRVINKSAPHPDRFGEPLRERHSAHGKPRGAPVIPHNLLTGNSARLPADQRKYPLEDKTTLPYMYGALVWLKHAAAVAGAPVFGLKVDYRWFFYQFRKHPFEYWYSMYTALLPRGSPVVWRWCCVTSRVMEMGDSPSSYVAQTFCNRYDEALLRAFDAIELRLAKLDDPALQQLVQRRVELMGFEASRLVNVSTYTDDQCSFVVGTQRHVAWTTHVVEHALRFRISLAPPVKLEIGSVINPIGGRFVLSTGFACVPPVKLRRALAGAVEALRGDVLMCDYARHCGLAAHVAQLLLFDHGSLNGIARPLYAEQALLGGCVTMTTASAIANRYVIQRLEDTPFVPFFAVGSTWRRTDVAAFARVPCITSDACTGSDTTDPAAGVWMEGLVFRFRFAPFWQKFHITCLEFISQKIGRLAMLPYLHGDPMVLMAGDATVAQLAMMQSSKSAAIVVVQQVAADHQELRSLQTKELVTHISGVNLWFADAVSRGRWATLDVVCAALRLKYHVVKAEPRVQAFMASLAAAFIAAAVLVQVALPSLLATCRKPGRHVVTFSPQPAPASGRRRRRPASVEGRTGVLTLRVGLLLASANAVVVPHMANPLSVDVRLRCPLSAIAAYDSRVEVVRFPPTGPGATTVAYAPSPLLNAGAPSSPSPLPTAAGPTSMRPSPLLARRAAATAAPSTPTTRPLRTAPGVRPSPLLRAPGVVAAGSYARSSPRAELQFTPRPHVTVRQALAQHAAHLGASLELDSSPWALFQGSPEALHQVMRDIGATQATGTKRGTSDKEEWAFGWWQRACAAAGTTWLRNDPAGFSTCADARAAWAARETVLTKSVALFLSRNVRNNVDRTKSAKPGTLKAIINVARGFLAQQLGCPKPPTPPLRTLFNGITDAYVRRHGQLALLVARKRVLPRTVSVRMLTLPFGTKIGNREINWESTYWLMVGAMFTTMLNTGLRKCSVSTAHPDDFQILLCNVSWWVGGEHVTEPTRDDLERVRPGDFVCIVPPAGDKTDAYGNAFGSDRMWFEYDPADVLGCAQWLLRREMAAPAPPGGRDRTPLFSPDGGGTPFAASALDALFRNWVAACVGADAAPNYSLHSCRATLASSLGVLDTATELIQALCRWRSPESVAQYRRLTAANYAALVRRAMDQDATTQPGRTVVTDDDEAMALLAADAVAPDDDGPEANGGAPAAAGTVLALLPVAPLAPPAAARAGLTAVPRPVVRRSVDVGPPYGVVDVDVGHALSDARVTVPNSVWEPGATGRVRCTVLGFATAACVADGQRIFVLQCPEGHMYAFASGVLASLLPRRLAQCLPVRRPPRPRQQAVTTATRTTSAVTAARRLRAPRRESRRSTAA